MSVVGCQWSVEEQTRCLPGLTSCAALFLFASRSFWGCSWSVARGDDRKTPARRATARRLRRKKPQAPRGTRQAAENRGEDADRRRAAKKTAKNPAPAAGKPVSFIRDVAPILVENCIACHNPRKSESKYVMTTFAQLAKGGQQGEGITLEPGKPDESNLVELIRPDGKPRMPYKQDPLPPKRSRRSSAGSPRGRSTTAARPAEDWTDPLPQDSAGQRSRPRIPRRCRSRPWSSARTARRSPRRVITRSPSGRRPTARSTAGWRAWPSGSTTSPTARTASGWPPPAAIRAIFGVAKLWAAEPGGGGKPVRDLVETQDVVFSVAFSPDSKKIATAGADRTIRIFEVETGKLLSQIEDHADWIFEVAFSPDGKRLASASRDKTSKVFDVEKKESLVTFPGHAQPVYTVSFTPDGKGVATGGEDNRIRVWNPDNDGKQIRDIGGFGGTVFKLRYSPDGKTLVACGARQDGPRLQAPTGLDPQAPGPQRLGLLPGDLARRQDHRLGELGRRGPALEPRRRQAAPHHHRRAGLQAGRHATASH